METRGELKQQQRRNPVPEKQVQLEAPPAVYKQTARGRRKLSDLAGPPAPTAVREEVTGKQTEFNDTNAKQYISPRPAQETQAQQPAVTRQTSFTNADAAQYEEPKRRTLADIPGRDFYGTATFQDRLNRFRENNPEFTPRSLRPNKGYTSNAGGAWEQELNARKARFAMSDALDVADRLNRPGRGGSINGRKAAAAIYSDIGAAQAGLAARPPQQMSTAGLGEATNQLTERRLAEEKLRSDQESSAADQAFKYQELGLKGVEAQRKAQLDEADFKLRNQASIRDTRKQVLDDMFGPQSAEGDNMARSEVGQFLDRSSTIESPEDVGRAAQFYKLAKPLMDAEGIATAVSPFLARWFDWAKNNATPLTNEADVKAAFDRFTSGKLDNGVQFDPTDLSARNRNIARQLRYQ